MADMPTPHEEQFRVRISDTGPGRKASIAAVADWLQEAAAAHARALGFSNRDLGKLGVAWVLARLAVRVDSYPVLGETVRVQTWPVSIKRLRARRDFRILGEDGAVIGAATSVWVALDMEKRRVAPMPDLVAHKYPARDDLAMELTAKSLPAPGEALAESNVLTRAADVDENSHVNNVRLLEWAMEPVPAEYPRFHPKLVDVTFRAECRHPETVAASCSVEDAPEPGMRALLHTLRRESDGAESVRARTWWPAE